MSFRKDLYIFITFLLLSCLSKNAKVTDKASASVIFDKYWKLVELNGTEPEATSREPHLVLNKAESRITGNGGCNSFFGIFQGGTDGKISFSNIGSTKMACPGLHVETEYFRALQQVQNYIFHGDTLARRNSTATVARFVAVEKANK